MQLMKIIFLPLSPFFLHGMQKSEENFNWNWVLMKNSQERTVQAKHCRQFCRRKLSGKMQKIQLNQPAFFMKRASTKKHEIISWKAYESGIEIEYKFSAFCFSSVQKGEQNEMFFSLSMCINLHRKCLYSMLLFAFSLRKLRCLKLYLWYIFCSLFSPRCNKLMIFYSFSFIDKFNFIHFYWQSCLSSPSPSLAGARLEHEKNSLRWTFRSLPRFSLETSA